MVFVGWIAALILVAGSTFYLAFEPDAYTPAFQLLLAIFLTIVSHFLGRQWEAGRQSRDVRAERLSATRPWIPQAESSVRRIVTLRASVDRLTDRVKTRCEEVACAVPELAKPELATVRQSLKDHCAATEDRLADVSNQLEDLAEEWARFFEANCDGYDCDRLRRLIRPQASGDSPDALT